MGRDAGVATNVLCNARLRSTGWTPEVSWREGLAKTAAWWAQGRPVIFP